MQPFFLRTAGLFLFLALPLSAADKIISPPKLELAEPKTTGADEGKPAPTLKPDSKLVLLLADNGLEARPDSSILQKASKTVIDKELLEKAGFAFDDKGRFIYRKSGDPVETDLIVPNLKGLLPFASAKNRSPAEVGKILRLLHIPAAFNGQHLMNPDGTATYYGLMLYEGIKDKPQATTQISGERLAKSLKLFDSAFGQAFSHNAPDIASADLARAWDMMGRKREGETPLPSASFQEPRIKDYRPKLNLEDARTAKDLPAMIEALNTLEKTRYHRERDLGRKEPEPPAAEGKPEPRDWKKYIEDPFGRDQTKEPKQSALPLLLQALDKINGEPLTAAQQEWLIKSFPMGESVWRMGVHKLWKEEITGKEVKVAVIDTGVAKHPDFADQVKSRENFTRSRGDDASGSHATHVAGTILALAPGAEVRSYRAISESSLFGNNRLQMDPFETERALISAVDKAVADGNHIVNLSLGSSVNASLARKIDGYAKTKGVIFIVAAGNDGARGPAGGVSSPAVAPQALTIGALDVNGRMSRFSSFGENWDPAKIGYTIKRVFMAPGEEIVSSAPPLFAGSAGHATMSGTSMAAPHSSGVAALLYEQARKLNSAASPMTLSALVLDALNESSKPMKVRELPADVPPDQDFVVIDPAAAYAALRKSREIPAAAK